MPKYRLTRGEHSYIIEFAEKEIKIFFIEPISLDILDQKSILKKTSQKEINFAGKKFGNLQYIVYSPREGYINTVFIEEFIVPQAGDILEEEKGNDVILIYKDSKNFRSYWDFVLNLFPQLKYGKGTQDYDYAPQENSLNKKTPGIIENDVVPSSENKSKTLSPQTQRNLDIFSFVIFALGFAFATAGMLAVTILTAGAAAGVFVPGAIGFLTAVIGTGTVFAAVPAFISFIIITVACASLTILSGTGLFVVIKAFPTDPSEPALASENVERDNPNQFQGVIGEVPTYSSAGLGANVSSPSFLTPPNSSDSNKRDQVATQNNSLNLSEENPDEEAPTEKKPSDSNNAL